MINFENSLGSNARRARQLGSGAASFLGEKLMRLSNLLEVKKGGEVVRDIVVDEIAPEGLGFGEGSISGKAESNEIKAEILEFAAGEILSDRHYKTVEALDSGCGDGRPVKSVYAKLKGKFNGAEHVLDADESKIRPKLFGGDFATLYSILAVSTEKGRDAGSFHEMDEYVVEILNSMGWVLGTHNDDHGDGPDDLHGCGAIDNRHKIINNSQKFKDDIKGALSELGLFNEAHSTLVNTVFESRDDKYFANYSGADRQAYLEGECDIVRKVLSGDHQEAFVVINTRKGTTFDQASLRRTLVSEYGEDEKLPQVFVVDIWQAESMIDKLVEKRHIEEDYKEIAMTAVLTYTLATAATLTDGTLPMFLAS